MSNARGWPRSLFWSFAFFYAVVLCPAPHVSVLAAQLPSVFRGVVVADSPLGVRVVSVQEESQAALADLRPDDIIVRIQEAEIHSIDEFATLSTTLKGRATSVKLTVFRNGEPHELLLHLYSYPILQEWHVEFIPEHDIRFAQPSIGLAYWQRLGRGFEMAGNTEEALSAYLNGLHNVSTDATVALKISELYVRASQEHFDRHELTKGIAALSKALVILQHLFDYSLTDEQLVTVKHLLQETLRALHDAKSQVPVASHSTS